MSAPPAGDDLKALPLRAVVAYAHRCAARAARRCVPAAGSGATAETAAARGCGEAIRRALQPAAKLAAGERVPPRELNDAEDVIVATLAGLGQDAARPGKPSPGGPDRSVALAVNAAYAALAAAAAVADESVGSRAIRGHRAVLSAVTAAEAAAAACPAIRPGLRKDLGLLGRLNLGAFPDLGRGVDVSDGGPLGRLGEEPRRHEPRPSGSGPDADPLPARPAEDEDEATRPLRPRLTGGDREAELDRREAAVAEGEARLAAANAALAAELAAVRADRQELAEALVPLRRLLADRPAADRPAAADPRGAAPFAVDLLPA